MQVVSRLLREPAPVMGSAGYDACSGHEKMISQLILQILIPTGLLGVLWRSRFRSRSEWLLSILVLGSILLFSFATARWDWFSYYLRILPVPLFLILSYSAYGQITPASTSPPPVSQMDWTGPQWSTVTWRDLVQRSRATRSLLFR